jgi:hypothetical protein
MRMSLIFNLIIESQSHHQTPPPMKNILCPLLLLSAAHAIGCDNPFGYSYLTETLKPGRTEIVQWVTTRFGRDVGSGYDARYRGVDLKTEYEFGLSANAQLSLYFNNRFFDGTARDGLRFDGFQVAYMRMLADPDKATWGQAIYIEPGYSQTSSKNGALRDEYSLELKYLAQRNFGAQQEGVYAANLVVEIERKPATDADAFKLKLTQGVAWELNKRWLAGLEVVAEAEWAEFTDFEYAAVLAGPCVRYQQENGLFATFTVLGQIVGSPADKGGLNVSEKSPYEARLKVGFEF